MWYFVCYVILQYGLTWWKQHDLITPNAFLRNVHSIGRFTFLFWILNANTFWKVGISCGMEILFSEQLYGLDRDKLLLLLVLLSSSNKSLATYDFMAAIRLVSGRLRTLILVQGPDAKSTEVNGNLSTNFNGLWLTTPDNWAGSRREENSH